MAAPSISSRPRDHGRSSFRPLCRFCTTIRRRPSLHGVEQEHLIYPQTIRWFAEVASFWSKEKSSSMPMGMRYALRSPWTHDAYLLFFVLSTFLTDVVQARHRSNFTKYRVIKSGQLVGEVQPNALNAPAAVPH